MMRSGFEARPAAQVRGPDMPTRNSMPLLPGSTADPKASRLQYVEAPPPPMATRSSDQGAVPSGPVPPTRAILFS